jgi:hypothetical protein
VLEIPPKGYFLLSVVPLTVFLFLFFGGGRWAGFRNIGEGQQLGAEAPYKDMVGRWAGYLDKDKDYQLGAEAPAPELPRRTLNSVYRNSAVFLPVIQSCSGRCKECFSAISGYPTI